MIKLIGRRKSTVLLMFTAIGLVPLAANAGTINIIISGLDVQYFNEAAGNTGSIYDSIAHPGGNLNPTEADAVSSVTFQFDGADQGVVVSPPADPTFGDLRIDGVGNPLGIGFHTDIGNNGGLFGFDWFTNAGLAGDHLRLGMTDLDVLVLSSAPAPGVFFFAGTANLLGTHQLPFLLKFTSETVTFSYTATQVTIVNGPPGAATKVFALGALTITGEGVIIPEPTGVVLCVTLAAGALALPRRRRA